MKTINLPLLLMMIALMACNKEESLDSQSDSGKKSGDNIYFYLDGTSVGENEINFDNEDLHFLCVFGEQEDTTSERVEIHAFSDSLDYLDYGDNNNMPLTLFDEITQHLRDTALSSGVIAESESEEAVPDWYTEYQEEYAEQAIEEASLSAAVVPTYVRKHCYSGPGTFLLPFGHPWLWAFGYKNDVESYIPYSTYGADMNFDKAFYKDRRWTMWTWGYQNIPLCEIHPFFMNDRNSWLTFRLL